MILSMNYLSYLEACICVGVLVERLDAGLRLCLHSTLMRAGRGTDTTLIPIDIVFFTLQRVLSSSLILTGPKPYY